MPRSRFAIVISAPLLPVSGLLLAMAGYQTVLLLDNILRFGGPAVVAMGGRALTYAIPGIAVAIVAVVALRHR